MPGRSLSKEGWVQVSNYLITYLKTFTYYLIE